MPIRLHPDLFSKTPILASTREGFGRGLLALGKIRPSVVALTADLSESTKLSAFREAFPDRFVECGVAEQNLIGIAAGLGLSGKIPFAASFAVFVPGRCLDQIRVSICYAKANVKLVGSHAGLATGPDGATHQALEDLAVMRVLPNMTVVSPCDATEAQKAVAALADIHGPAYLRLTREPSPLIFPSTHLFVMGKHPILRQGADVTIAATGPLVYEALIAAKSLAKKKIRAEVINCSTIKPFDEATLIASLKKTGACVTVEDHQIAGGLFGIIAEITCRFFPVPMEPIGVEDQFGQSGQKQELYETYKLTAPDITQAAERVIKRKR